MKTVKVITFALVLTFCSCASRSPYQSAGESHTAYLARLPNFGKQSPNSIRVTIFGYAVNRPGHYFLPHGSTIRDVMKIAQFNGRAGWLYPYSGIQKPQSDGSVKTIWFTLETRAADEDRVLQNNDVLQLSHEVY